MKRSIYSYYKERLVQIGGRTPCLFLRGESKKSAYDLGRVIEGKRELADELNELVFSQKSAPLRFIEPSRGAEIYSRRPSALGASDTEAYRRPTQESILHAVDNEITHLRELAREADAIEKDTGRHELYLGYPFVFGTIGRGSNRTPIKAPLLLIPVCINIIDECTAEVRRDRREKIRINPSLLYTYAQSKRLSIDSIDTELDDLSELGSVNEVLHMLEAARIRIATQQRTTIHRYDTLPPETAEDRLSLRYAAIIGRFPISNDIYRDYSLLEKRHLSSPAIEALLRCTGNKERDKREKEDLKKKKKDKKSSKEAPRYFSTKLLDYSQSSVVKQVSANGNTVIYGPPGTGKSQTIVSIISDALAKGKRVLVVSQKKAALDVVYNRLARLQSRAVYVNDEGKQRRDFYERTLVAHEAMLATRSTPSESLKRFDELQAGIERESAKLAALDAALNEKRPFGLSLCEMYSASHNLRRGTAEFELYESLCADPLLMKATYKDITDALFNIKSLGLDDMYFKHMQDRDKNPLIGSMLHGLDARTLAEAKGSIEAASRSFRPAFDLEKHPYFRHVIAFYDKLTSTKVKDELAELISRSEHPRLIGRAKARKRIRRSIESTATEVTRVAVRYECLGKIMTHGGVANVINEIMTGNTACIRQLLRAIDDYIIKRDTVKTFDAIGECESALLEFAYSGGRTRSAFDNALESVPTLRMYHEILKAEEEHADVLAVSRDFDGISSTVYALMEEQLSLCAQIAESNGGDAYRRMYETRKDNKDYLYQISKKQKLRPIRKLVETYGDYLLTLFPCWILSPENVSGILPLEREMFDLVIFDEASQIFIENTVPAIYRARFVVVAGDDKQLRPSAAFMKRYLGSDPEDQAESVQAALEVDSLLDLAVTRFDSARLTYHYRSRAEELIAFSDRAFYGGTLQIAPNISPMRTDRPIERIKVDGRWTDRHNAKEAEATVQLICDILTTRKNGESIGVITFNSEQQSHISDLLEKRMLRDATLRTPIMREKERTENGEDVSLFIKNLENVQGDERDIIIFSVGYARGTDGKVHSAFGSLSAEGGENRLNVAITRAKKKIYLVTSIEPEELNVDTSKYQGPRLLKKYLEYVRAVSDGRNAESGRILDALHTTDCKDSTAVRGDVAAQMREQLEHCGFTVTQAPSGESGSISLAILDTESDRYLLGIELDCDAYEGSRAVMERDVCKPRFLESRGWLILRVWCRDWWHNPKRVIKEIVTAAQKQQSHAKEHTN